MTELRDARFKRALQAAPDAQLGPQGATRRAVRDAAAHAVAPRAGQRRWWSAWWLRAERRMPWNAAFATVLLASLVTLLWQGREVPDARTDGARVDAPVPAPQPAPAPIAPPMPDAPAAAPPAAPEPQPAVRAAPTPPRRLAKEQPATQPADAAVRQESEARRQKAAPDLARQREAAALSDAAAPQAAQPSAVPPSPPSAGAPAPAATPAPAAPAAAPRMAPAAPADLSARFQAVPGREQWSQLTIGHPGGALTVARESAPRLASLIDRAAASATQAEPLAQAPQSRLELSRDGRLLGVLEISGDQVRWAAPGSAGSTGRPDPDVLRALREELQRLQPR